MARILDILMQFKTVPSRSEARRLIAQGAVKFDGHLVQEGDTIADGNHTITIGKTKCFEVSVQDGNEELAETMCELSDEREALKRARERIDELDAEGKQWEERLKHLREIKDARFASDLCKEDAQLTVGLVRAIAIMEGREP